MHYGFAVVTKGATLGVNGRGRLTYLRLTEMGAGRSEPDAGLPQMGRRPF
jgi:hypothetical protein